MWNNRVITNAGLDLIARSQVEDTPLIITKCKTSSKVYTVEQLPILNDLENIEQEINITEKKSKGSNVLLRIDITNEEVLTAYYLRTMGIYGKIGSEEEKLIFVAINDETEQVPTASQELWETIFNINIPFSNTNNITIQIDYASQATQQFVLDKFEEFSSSYSIIEMSIDSADYELITDAQSKTYYKYTATLNSLKENLCYGRDIYMGNTTLLETMEKYEEEWASILKFNIYDGYAEIFIREIPTVILPIKIKAI